jgi:hypothetical protein
LPRNLAGAVPACPSVWALVEAHPKQSFATGGGAKEAKEPEKTHQPGRLAMCES